jgi:hypothetical protein
VQVNVADRLDAGEAGYDRSLPLPFDAGTIACLELRRSLYNAKYLTINDFRRRFIP